MGLFGKKKKEGTAAVLENKHYIDESAQLIDVLVCMSGSDKFTERLKLFQDKLKYSNPTTDERALNLDKKISDKIGDLKIEINKTRNWEDVSKLNDLIGELEMLLTERNAYANSKVGK